MAAERQQRGGISLQTLLVASVASGAAALVTSQLWEDGKVLSAIFTPILVTLVSELLHRPVERISSVTVRRPAVRVGASPTAADGERDPVPGWAEGREPGTGAAREDLDGVPPAPPAGDGTALGPRRVYSKRRPVRWRRALAAGLAAFVIGAAVLTLPELLAGEAIGGGGRTTLFSSGSGQGDEDGSDRDRGGESPGGEGGSGGAGGSGSEGSGGGGSPDGGQAPDDGGGEPAPAPEQPAPSAPAPPSSPAP